jgi:hypothetical protein
MKKLADRGSTYNQLSSVKEGEKEGRGDAHPNPRLVQSEELSDELSEIDSRISDVVQRQLLPVPLPFCIAHLHRKICPHSSVPIREEDEMRTHSWLLLYS